ncbi:MAG: hypothetical protein IPG56_01280 [Caulobacteraceae bacterium]|nr:hypothetical protein [Caulobacteraceae bacterium]
MGRRSARHLRRSRLHHRPWPALDLSSRFVFADSLAASRTARARQAALFFASGFGGLAVTVATFTTAVTLGAPAIIAKALSVGVSFCIVYLIRRHLIFAPRP